MKNLLLSAIASASVAISSTAAHSQTILGELAKLPPQQQQVAAYALMHYSINLFHPNGVPLQRSDQEFSTVVHYTAVCDLAVVWGLRDGLISTAEQAARGKQRCLQKELNIQGMSFIIVLNQHY